MCLLFLGIRTGVCSSATQLSVFVTDFCKKRYTNKTDLNQTISYDDLWKTIDLRIHFFAARYRL